MTHVIQSEAELRTLHPDVPQREIEWLARAQRATGVNAHEIMMGDAAREGHIWRMARLLELGRARVDCCDNWPLRLSVAAGNLAATQFLMEKGANAEGWQECLLDLSARSGNVEMLRYLAELPGIDIARHGLQAMLSAASTGNIPILQFFEDRFGSLKSYGEQLLTGAAENGKPAMVEFLLQRGCAETCNLGALRYSARVQKNPEVSALLKIWHETESLALPKVNARVDMRLADLRMKSPSRGQSYILLLARSRNAGVFLAAAAQANTQEGGQAALALSDLQEKDEYGFSALDWLGRTKALDALFVPEIWCGRVAEMQEVWQAVPEGYRDQLDFTVALERANLHTLMRRAGNGAEKFRRKKPQHQP